MIVHSSFSNTFLFAPKFVISLFMFFFFLWQVGLDREAAQKHMEDSAVKEKVRKEYMTSVREWEVTGVPFFVINTDTNQGQPYAFSGAQPPETFTNVFERLLGSSSSL